MNALQMKYDSVLAILEQHNESIGGEDRPGYVDIQAFITCLKAAGGTTEERLAELSWDDILDCLPAFNGIKPKVLAKTIAKVFRADQVDQSQSRPVTSKKAERMTLRELIANFDPYECDSPIGDRLSRISNGKNFIVFLSDDITIDVDTTFKLLQEIKQGYDGRDNVEVNGEIRSVHPVGYRPDNYADENPLYPGRPLRPDGTCDQTGRSWEGVPINVRQLIRIALNYDHLTVDIELSHRIMDIALQTDAFDALKKRYRRSATEFYRLEKIGNLPKLKIVLGEESSIHSPFDKGRKVEFVAPLKNKRVISSNYLNRGGKWVPHAWR